MFAYIKGSLEEKGTNYVVIENGNIGYKIFMSNISINEIGDLGTNVKVYTHYYVREDNISLYGFLTHEELKMFELLCKNDYFKSHTPNIIHDFNFQEFDYSDLKTVTFEVTQRCNLRCKYCINGEMYNHDENDYTENLSFGKAKAVIDFLIDKIQGGSSVKSKITFGFYGGEPLLQIDLIKEIVEYINKNVSPITPIDFTMTTNGLLLKEHIDFIVNNNFLLLVSFDGNRKHSEYRIPIGEEKLFSKLYNNIKFIQKEYPSYFKERITFNTVLHDKTELAPILEFFKNEFEKLPCIEDVEILRNILYAGVWDKYDKKKEKEDGKESL